MTRKIFRCPGDGKKCDDLDRALCGRFCLYAQPDDEEEKIEVIL